MNFSKSRVKIEPLERLAGDVTTQLKDKNTVVLVFFVWAGGNILHPALQKFVAALKKNKPNVLAMGVSLPGRISLAGQPYTDFQQLVPAVVSSLEEFNARCHPQIKFIYVGYSLGSLLATQVLAKMGLAFQKDRMLLFVAAACKTIFDDFEEQSKVHNMSEAELVKYMVEKGGTPKELLASKDMRAMILPPIRVSVGGGSCVNW
mmetsp:Transcript_22574/g.35958  ORF Transcript_22574/g.35958 Transcript_22574/m.35958 type:complete len:204 (-) Transcript_22574:243-854(-)